jgi:methylated-DNA-protein-cysteine methyltransferase-like protein
MRKDIQGTATKNNKRSTEGRRASAHQPAQPRADADYRKRVFQIVRRIPSGRVMTYGQIAAILGEGYTPRTVGFVMHSSGEQDVPWHRVINAQGACSTVRIVLPANRQQGMLESEGVEFDQQGRCDLRRYLWEPKAKRPKQSVTLFKK